MPKGLKVFLVIGLLLLVLGGAFIGIGYATNAFGMATTKDNTYEIKGEFNKLNLKLETADLTINLATDGKEKVDVVENEKVKYEVKVENNTLVINVVSELKWYERMFSFIYQRGLKVNVYLNKTDYEEFKLDIATGNVKLAENFSFNNLKIEDSTGDLTINSNVISQVDISTSTGTINLSKINSEATVNLKVSTGNIKLSNLRIGSLKTTSSTGDVKLDDVVVKTTINITTSTGEVKFFKSDAESIKVKTSTGDVEGSLLSGKTFYTKTSTGKVDVPRTTGGDCDIETSTGDIKITIAA